MLLHRRPPRRGSSAGHSSNGERRRQLGRSHLRRPPEGGGTSKPAPKVDQKPDAVERGAPPHGGHFSPANQSSRTCPCAASALASAGKSTLSSLWSRHGGLTTISPAPARRSVAAPEGATVESSARRMRGMPSPLRRRAKRPVARASFSGYQSR